MILDISNKSKQLYRINTAGMHLFYLRNTTAKLTFQITAQNATVYIFGIYDTAQNDNYKLDITTHHLAAHSQSHVLVKSVLRKNAQFHFTGNIRVDTTAPHTTASLDNRNLVLSPQTTVTTIPQLQISPSAVSCHHSATTATPDPTQIHYLQTRTLNPKTATKLLVNGFIDDIQNQVDTISNNIK